MATMVTILTAIASTMPMLQVKPPLQALVLLQARSRLLQLELRRNAGAVGLEAVAVAAASSGAWASHPVMLQQFSPSAVLLAPVHWLDLQAAPPASVALGGAAYRLSATLLQPSASAAWLRACSHPT